MPANYVLLEKITVGAAGAASVTFANIPQTGYSDLVLKSSARSNRAASEDGLGITVNSASSGYTYRILSGNGSSASSVATAYEQIWAARLNGNTTTSNTFTNSEFYFPNYASSTAKSYSGDTVTENNATEAFATMSAVLQSSTSAITSLTIQAINGSLMANSTFYLYGVAKLGTTPAIAPKAAGGDIVMTDGTYWYHAFRSSGTFTPQVALSCDILQVAGGGGGGSRSGGGGGAGGISYLASQSVGASAQTVTVGAGGTPGSRAVAGTNGTNSQFASLTAAIGGGFGGSALASLSGNTGGSGGGAANGATGSAGTSGQGFAGGSSNATSYDAGGGGGAGAVGANASTGSIGTGAGAGGVGVNTYATWLNTTGTGVSGFIAGGGGGGSFGSSNHGAGGSGGGGAGADSSPTAGTANTGGGGGGAGNSANTNTTPTGAAGGSGLVIVRYLVA